MTSHGNGTPVATTTAAALTPNSQAMTGEEVMSEDEARKRREQLNRRPSYRMILKDLETADKVLKKEPDETPPPSVDASPLQVHIPGSSSGSGPAGGQTGPTGGRAAGGGGGGGAGGGPSPYASPLGTNMLNGDMSLPHSLDFAAVVAAATSSTAHHGAAHAINSAAGFSGLHGPLLSLGNDNPMLKPLSGMDPSQFAEWQSPLMSGYSSSPSPTNMAGSSGRMGGEDESSRKRQVRLLKNREAAKECRRKKKEYVKCLENRVAVLENQNKALIEELKTLKELYCRKEKQDM